MLRARLCVCATMRLPREFMTFLPVASTASNVGARLGAGAMEATCP